MTDPLTTFDPADGNGGSPSTTKRALLAIRDLRAELDSIRGQNNQPIAIVGMGCRFPGAPDLDSFWTMLCQKGEGVREVPPERWNPSRYYHPDPKTPGKIAGRWGGFLDGLDLFDATFFGISPREAPHVDPRQRKILEVCWEALENAGIPPHSLAGSATGVYIATLSNDYDMMFSRNYRRFTSSTGTGTANSIIANRLSYLLDLHGPSLTLDTACSGSLLAIELACRSLRSGESSVAIAGGVSLNLLPKGDVFFSSAGALSPTGSCRTFDAGADGIVRSEGAGVVILKRVSDAIEDGDRIYAVVRGGAINHDGSSNGIMAPNGEAQKRVLREAYRNAGIAPRTVQYIEAHGTGTPLGDPIEMSALASVMADGRNGTPLVLGSLKTNVGHMEAAAGVAGVIKVALSMHHRALPPTRHFTQWNPRIPKPPFIAEVRSELGEWPVSSMPRVAGVSGFSFGGTNAHLVLQEAPASVETAARPTDDRSYVLPLSAKSPDALRDLAGAYSGFLEKGPELRDVCFTAGARRSHYNYRLAVVGSNAAEMTAKLAAIHAPAPGRRLTKLAWVFSGQGSHWKGMGQDLAQKEPVFRQILETCDLLFAQNTGWSVVEEIRSGSRLHQTDISQAAVFSIQVALAGLWRSWGIQPAAVVGQSLGEVAAAHVAGALSLESAVAVVHHRSRLMKTLAGTGKTAVVGLTPDAARELIADWNGDLHVAGSSSPETSVVSGTPAAIEAMLSATRQRGIFVRDIADIDVAFHSPHMEPLRRDLESSLDRIECAKARTGMMSTVTGEWLNGNMPDARYWGRNLCEPFQLTSAVDKLIGDGFDGFLEISPSSVLSGAIRQTLAVAGTEALVLASCRRDEPEHDAMLASLAELYAAGSDVHWSALYADRGRCVSLPPYRWQRERYWIDQLPGGPDTSTKSSDEHPLLGEPTESALPGGQRFWEQSIDLTSLTYLAGHKVLGSTVFPGAAFLECAFAAMGRVRREAGPVEISDLLFHEPMPLAADSPRHLQLALSPRAGGAYDLRFSTRENSSSAWTLNASCTAIPVDVTAGVSGLDHFRQTCVESIDRQVHYDAMAAHGLEYSGDFLAIRGLWRDEREAFAELQLEAGASASAADYGVHPVLIDAALQVVAATLDHPEDSSYSPENYLPHGIAQARFFASPGDRAICTARLTSGKSGDAELLADVRLLDSDGQICVEIDGLCLRRVGSGWTGARGKLHDWLYDLAWEETPRTDSAAANSGSWTILADRNGLAEKLAAELQERGHNCVVVPAGDPKWELPVDGAQSGIVDLRGLDNAEDPCNLVLPLVQRLAQSGKKEIPSLWIVTRQTQAASGAQPTLTPAAQLWGFGKVVALEHPEMWGGLIDLDAARDDDASLLADEILAPDAERQLTFRSSNRYAARLRPASELSKPDPVVFHADATYLITGGLGGLGLAVARWMTERGARRFILTGRTPLPSRSQWRTLPAEHPAKSRVEAIRELERLGTSVHPAAFDISDADQTKAFVDAFHAEGWSPIRGVIHAAGVVDDQLMLRLDAETFAKVLRPKVAGALALHQATKDLDLDFFTLFSSVSSVLGQFGQAHYAAGNAFMDHLAHWRRAQGLKATTINWGPWAETGIYARIDVADKTGRSGVFPMLPNQALQAMEYVQATAPVQSVVVSADWSRMPPSPLLTGLAPSGIAAARSVEDEQAAAALLLELLLAEPDDRRRRLEEILQTAAARVLRLDASRLDIREPLTSFGMDSIMVVELRNYIEKTMNLSISMVDLFTGTVAKLAEQVADKLADGTQLEELLTQVETMSPEEIQAFLGEETGSLN